MIRWTANWWSQHYTKLYQLVKTKLSTHRYVGSQFTNFGFENLLHRHKIDHSHPKLEFPSISHLILDVYKYIH